MPLDWTQPELAAGLACYRAGEFFAAHEQWEIVWLAATGPEKTLLQALIQVTAACHHARRGNARGASSLFRTALRRLEAPAAVRGGIAVPVLCADIRTVLRTLETPDDARPLVFPAIRLEGG